MKGKRVLLYTLLAVFLLFALFVGIGTIGRFLYPLHYREYIFKYADDYGIDPYLVAAVIRVESKYQPTAVSSEGAVGLMQIMPRTALWLAPRAGLEGMEPDMLTDPEVNIRLGTYYLAELYRRFDGSTAQVLAAYNGGQGTVRRWLEDDRWDGEQLSMDQIPYRETREYVQKTLVSYRRYRWLYEDYVQIFGLSGGS